MKKITNQQVKTSLSEARKNLDNKGAAQNRGHGPLLRFNQLNPPSKKEYWLLIGSVLFSIALGLLLIRWMAPQLLGMPRDSQIVQLSKELPAFFETVFHNQAEKESKDFLINDPITLVRARPLISKNAIKGPHDVLGFRNYSVPNMAPIVVIGDSQTYGINASIDSNWPSELAKKLNLPSTAIYSMATGGWGAIQYLNMLTIAPRFKPCAIIVAFYTGNDPLESFKLAYGIDKWHRLRPDSALSLDDMPKVPFPAPESEWWKAVLQDGTSMIFTPRHRYYSNDPASAAATVGYAIMAESARRMDGDETIRGNGIRLILTIIPTKELAYAKRIEQEGISPPQDYQNLIAAELRNIKTLEGHFKGFSNAKYVNLIEPLQQAVLKGNGYYPASEDGHPLPLGYAVIGETMAKALGDFPIPPAGECPPAR